MKFRLHILWGFVALFVIGTAIGLVWFYGQVRHQEFERSQREAQVANDAFAEHTANIVNQADNLLRAVRGYYLTTRSVAQTKRFIDSMDVENNLFANIYLSDAEGYWLINHDAPGKHLSTRQRAQFRFHQATPEDVIYFAPTDKGAITGQYHFRITRRISLPDGKFGGVVSVHIHPTALTDYYRRLSGRRDTIASLIGSQDHLIRARYPEPEKSVYEQAIQSPLWEALESAPSGTYRSPSVVDGAVRQFIYQQVSELPLIMVNGFSEADVDIEVRQRLRLPLLAALSACVLLVMIAIILTLGWRRQVLEQRHLIELQEANDRNSALFSATHDAVILLDGACPIDCNPATLTLFGAASKEEFLALPPWSPRINPPFQADGIDTETYAKQQVELVIRNGVHHLECTHKRLDNGAEFQVDIMLTAIQFNGRTLIQAVLRDISERKRFEQEIQSANQQLIHRNDEQNRFISMLSHELKTPLSVIRMSLGTAVEVINELSRSRLIRAVADINAIIERCLQTDRLEHHRIDRVATVCHPDELLRRLVEACSEPERVSLQIAELPEIVTDPQLLGTIVVNLIDNAIKYGAPDTPISVSAGLQSRAGQEGLLISFSNLAGVAGMPDSQQVFRRYYRAPGAHAKTGSGLGLHIAEGFARVLGGELSYRPLANTVNFELWIPH
ncbi:MAG: ATP-binding protein [Betaproteobacteria bacterium]